MVFRRSTHGSLNMAYLGHMVHVEDIAETPRIGANWIRIVSAKVDDLDEISFLCKVLK